MRGVSPLLGKENGMSKDVFIREGKEEFAVVRKEKYYKFHNISGRTFIVNSLVFNKDPNHEQSTHEFVAEKDRITILKNRFVERGFLEELDDEGNVISASLKEGDVPQYAVTDKVLLDKMHGSKKSLEKYLSSIGQNDMHIFKRMLQLCEDKDLPLKTYILIRDTFKDKSR